MVSEKRFYEIMTEEGVSDKSEIDVAWDKTRKTRTRLSMNPLSMFMPELGEQLVKIAAAVLLANGGPCMKKDRFATILKDEDVVDEKTIDKLWHATPMIPDTEKAEQTLRKYIQDFGIAKKKIMSKEDFYRILREEKMPEELIEKGWMLNEDRLIFVSDEEKMRQEAREALREMETLEEMRQMPRGNHIIQSILQNPEIAEKLGRDGFAQVLIPGPSEECDCENCPESDSCPYYQIDGIPNDTIEEIDLDEIGEPLLGPKSFGQKKPTLH